MSAKILLNLSVRGVTMAVFAQRKLSDARSFANDEPARKAFASLLAAHQRTPVYVMVDVAEEDFRSETLPHVAGRARREMVARKLAQLFRTAPYRAAWLQGRGQDRRRDDQYLFLALNNAELLRPYLEIIEACHAPLAGIYLLPVVSQALVERIKPDVPGVLLVSRQRAGLRQSFFLDGKLRMSRLTPLDPGNDQAFEQSFVGEIEKSRLFIYNARLFSRDAPLRVSIVDPTGALQGVCLGLTPETNLQCEVLGFEALAKAFGMAAADLPRDMDAMLLCLLGRHRPDCSLALPRETRGFAYHQLRNVIHGAAASVAALAIAWSGYNLYADVDYGKRMLAARNETAALRAQYEEAARRFPAAPAAAEDMRSAVDAVEAMRQHARTPETAMRLLGQSLAAYPAIELAKLEWRYGGDGKTAPGVAAAAPQQWQESVEVSAQIRPFDGDYRAALKLIEQFAQDLRSRPGIAEVRVVELPVNLDPKSGLSGNTQDVVDARAASAQFRLALTLRQAG